MIYWWYWDVNSYFISTSIRREKCCNDSYFSILSNQKLNSLVSNTLGLNHKMLQDDTFVSCKLKFHIKMN